MTERKLSYHALALPICRVEQEQQENYRIKGEILGTCFAIGNTHLITAAHVISDLTAIQSNAGVMLLNPEGQSFHIAPIIATEILHADIGILQIEPKQGKLWFGRARWRGTPLSEFERIRAFGYPYGLHTVGDRQQIVLRSFEGHTVVHLREYLPLGMSGDPFSVYELSFATPRGLSGAPLCTFTDNNVRVHGVVIGNSQSSMLVFQSSEKSTEKDGERTETTIVERYESLSLGIAVDMLTIKELKSGLLGSTVGAFLTTNELLTP